MRALSWGIGVQSTAIAVMATLGDIEPFDAIVTADTGWERAQTYASRDFYTAWLKERGQHVEIVSAGNVRELGAENHTHIPFWTSTGGPLRRQCTLKFKIIPIKRRLRELAGYHATKPPHPPAGSIMLNLGISWDEWQRIATSSIRFIVNQYPLIDMKMTRNDCIAYLENRGLPVPVKSACIGCPYRRASEWLEMRDTSPTEWQEVVEFDKRNRHNPLAEHGRSTADEIYVYSHCEPLETADLEKHARHERVGKQVPLFICESGYCLV